MKIKQGDAKATLARTAPATCYAGSASPRQISSGSPLAKRSFRGASLEYAVMHGDEEEAERIREELRRLTDEG